MSSYSDEDVETAARILYERAMGPFGMWSTVPASALDIFRRDARAVLDAVAPRIAERAWDEGYDVGRTHENWRHGTGPNVTTPRNPYAPDGGAAT